MGMGLVMVRIGLILSLRDLDKEELEPNLLLCHKAKYHFSATYK